MYFADVEASARVIGWIIVVVGGIVICLGPLIWLDYWRKGRGREKDAVQTLCLFVVIGVGIVVIAVALLVSPQSAGQ